jgi:hypothetical protein
MNTDFANAMRSAMNLVRDQDLAEATRIIQGALSGVQPLSSGSPGKAELVPLAIENRFIDLTAEVIEPETAGSAEIQTNTQLDQSQRQHQRSGKPDLSATFSRSSARLTLPHSAGRKRR